MPTHSLSLTHSFTHSLTHSLTHSFTHSLTPRPHQHRTTGAHMIQLSACRQHPSSRLDASTLKPHALQHCKRGVDRSPHPPLGLCLTRQLLRLSEKEKLLPRLQIHRVALALNVQLRSKADDKAANLGGRALRKNRRNKFLQEVGIIRASALGYRHMQDFWKTLLGAHLTSKLMSPLPSASIVSKNPCTWLAR